MNNNDPQKIFNILVIGANGGIGRQAVVAALNAGHRVTAVLRNPANLTLTHPMLEVIKGDILHPATYERSLEKKDAVISAIGTKGTGPTTIYSQGNAALLRVMQEKGVRRAFFISASALEISPVLPFYVRLAEKYIVQKILRNMYADLRIMEHLVKESDTDWTILRPPRLTDAEATGHYRWAANAFLKNCLKISRADLAHFMIRSMEDRTTWQAIVEVGY